LLLLVAIVIAATGSFLVYLYASKADARAVQGQHPVAVLVARGNIPAGMTGTAAQTGGLIVKKTIARADAVSTALAPDNLTSINGKVALSNIYPGEQILTVQFGAVGQTTGGLTLPHGLLAVSVQLTDPARVAGFVRPQSTVAVFVTTTQRSGTGAGASSTKLLIDRALVVAVGTSVGDSPNGTASKAVAAGDQAQMAMTLALSQTDVQRLIFAMQQGSLYFALLSPDSTVTPTDPGVSAGNLFPPRGTG